MRVAGENECAHTSGRRGTVGAMTIHKIKPDTMPPTHGYPQVIVATGTKLVFTSGQVALNTDEKLVANRTDHEGQTYQSVLNGYAGIAASGGQPTDVVRLMIYVVDPTPDNLEKVYAGYGKALAELAAKPSAMTLIGVSGLSDPDHTVEIDLTAVLD